MTRWLHYLLTLTLLLNAVALPWSQAHCPHRAALLALTMQADQPCHQAGQQAPGDQDSVIGDQCACGCIVQAALSMAIAIPASQALQLPFATALISAPNEPSIARLLRPPIA